MERRPLYISGWGVALISRWSFHENSCDCVKLDFYILSGVLYMIYGKKEPILRLWSMAIQIIL